MCDLESLETPGLVYNISWEPGEPGEYGIVECLLRDGRSQRFFKKRLVLINMGHLQED